jgi:hypothetical protein
MKKKTTQPAKKAFVAKSEAPVLKQTAIESETFIVADTVNADPLPNIEEVSTDANTEMETGPGNDEEIDTINIDVDSGATSEDEDISSGSDLNEVRVSPQGPEVPTKQNLETQVFKVEDIIDFLDDYRTDYTQNTDGKSITDINLAMNHFQYGLNSLKKFRKQVEDIG